MNVKRNALQSKMLVSKRTALTQASVPTISPRSLKGYSSYPEDVFGGSCWISHECAPSSLFTIVIASLLRLLVHCVWLYFRFALSFRDVEEMLAMRSVALSYRLIAERDTAHASVKYAARKPPITSSAVNLTIPSGTMPPYRRIELIVLASRLPARI